MGAQCATTRPELCTKVTPDTTLGWQLVTTACEPGTWHIAMNGAVYGLNGAEVRQRLCAYEAEEAVMSHLITAAERGIVAGHAERMARIKPSTSKMVH